MNLTAVQCTLLRIWEVRKHLHPSGQEAMDSDTSSCLPGLCDLEQMTVSLNLSVFIWKVKRILSTSKRILLQEWNQSTCVKLWAPGEQSIQTGFLSASLLAQLDDPGNSGCVKTGLFIGWDLKDILLISHQRAPTSAERLLLPHLTLLLSQSSYHECLF